MLPVVTNSVLCGGGCAQLAGFVQQEARQQQQPPLARAQQQHSTSSNARLPHARPAAGAGLLVMASACCPPRSGRFQAQASRSRLRRRRRGSTGGDDGDGSLFGGSGDWSSFDALNSLCYLSGGGGGGGGHNNGGGGGGWNHHGGAHGGGGDAFHRVMYDSMWVWQVLCAASMLQSIYFVLFPAAAGTAAVAAPIGAAGRGAVGVAQVAMAC